MIEFAAVAFILALAFVARAILAEQFRSRFRTLGVLWALYAVYEYLMYTRVLCTGECNIRVDLMLIYPGLLGLTIWFVGASVIHWLRMDSR